MSAPRCKFTYPDGTQCGKRASADYVRDPEIGDTLKTKFAGWLDYCLRHGDVRVRKIDSNPKRDTTPLAINTEPLRATHTNDGRCECGQPAGHS